MIKQEKLMTLDRFPLQQVRNIIIIILNLLLKLAAAKGLSVLLFGDIEQAARMIVSLV